MTRRGFTLVEVVVAMALMAIIIVPLVRFFRASAKGMMKGTQRVAADEALRKAMDVLQRDLMYMTELELAQPAQIQFQLDSDRVPGYQPDGDSDLDTIPNRVDPDRDNDAMGLPAAAGPALFFGYDAWDQSDDGDNSVDARVRFRLDGSDLVREAIYNGVGAPAWGNREVICRNVRVFTLDYFGSLAYLDGGVDGDNNGVVTEAELAAPAGGIGNGMPLDIPQELDSVAVVSVRLEVDQNQDGKTDGKAESELVLLLMPAKRKTP